MLSVQATVAVVVQRRILESGRVIVALVLPHLRQLVAGIISIDRRGVDRAAVAAGSGSIPIHYLGLRHTAQHVMINDLLPSLVDATYQCSLIGKRDNLA